MGLGHSGPETVAPWLRRTYAALFVAYGLTTLALARRYLPPGLALAATTLCLLHAWTIFLSDLLFAEIPFALVSVDFALVAGGRASTTRLRETRGVYARCGRLPRAHSRRGASRAWVIDALARRHWRLALMRGLLAVLPIALWQAYVADVRASDAYVHPAYEYQRAPYQNYNVPYAENILLVDPFRPELGQADGGALAARFVTNFARMPLALGEAVSAPKYSWESALERPTACLANTFSRLGVVWVPILGFGTLVLAGSVVFIRRHDWTLASIVLLSIVLGLFNAVARGVWTLPDADSPVPNHCALFCPWSDSTPRCGRADHVGQSCRDA